MQNEDKEVSLQVLLFVPKRELILGFLNIVLELLHGVLEGCAGIIDLVDDKNVLANQVGHRGVHVEPLQASDLGAGDLLDAVCAQLLVEGQTDGLDRDVRLTRSLEEGSVRQVGISIVQMKGHV